MALIIDLNHLFLMTSNYLARMRQTNQYLPRPVEVSSTTPEGAALQALKHTYGTIYFNLTEEQSSSSSIIVYSYKIDEDFANTHLVDFANQLININQGIIQLSKKS